MTIAASTRLGHYEIRSQLGAGGMGEVYLAGRHALASQGGLEVFSHTIRTQKQKGGQLTVT